MKAFYLTAIVLGTVSIATTQVSPEDHAAHHPDQAAAAKSAPDPAISDMQARMKSMQELMDKLGQTKDPAERARLLAQHRKAMHEQLASMQHMDCAMMGSSAGKPAGSGGAMGQGMHNDMMNAAMMRCHEMMQARMDMMVGMMDQMMRYQEAQAAPH